MNESGNQKAQLQLVEILSLIPARLMGQDALAIVVRPDPTRNFGHKNLCVTRAQAERLREDLNALLDSAQPIWCS